MLMMGWFFIFLGMELMSLSRLFSYPSIEKNEVHCPVIYGIHMNYDLAITCFSNESNFYFSHLQPLMLVVPDVQDVYTPLETDVIVQLAEVRNITCQDLSDAGLQILSFGINFLMVLFEDLVSPASGAIAGKHSNHVSE